MAPKTAKKASYECSSSSLTVRLSLPQTELLLTRCTTGYTSDVLSDSLLYAEHARTVASNIPAQNLVPSLDDVRIAVQARTEGASVPKEVCPSPSSSYPTNPSSSSSSNSLQQSMRTPSPPSQKCTASDSPLPPPASPLPISPSSRGPLRLERRRERRTRVMRGCLGMILRERRMMRRRRMRRWRMLRLALEGRGVLKEGRGRRRTTRIMIERMLCN